jgi:hypothetical protein
MSVNMAAGDIVKFSVWCTDGNQAAVNTFYYAINASAGSGCSDLEAAHEFEILMAPLYKVNLNNNAIFNGVQCQILRAGNKFIAQQSIALTGAGTGGAVSLPRQCAGLISWKTDKAGQKNRGRTYLPFFSSSSDVGDGSMNAGTQTNVLAVATTALAIGTLGTGGNTSHFALSLKHGAPKNVQPLADPIINGTVKPQWATQRKRGFFGRPNVSPI